MRKIHTYTAFMCVLFFVIILAGCASFTARYNSPADCLEGKDYTIRITIYGNITGITLYYSLNRGVFVEISPQQAGSVYQHIIPGKDVTAGTIEYYAIVLDKDGKPQQTETAVVRVLTATQGKAKEEAELYYRVKFLGKQRGAITVDLPLSWTISPNPYDAGITLYYRMEGRSGYERQQLIAQGGIFGLVIQQSEVFEGSLQYYLEVRESHPDFGDLEITFPQNGDTRPALVKILGMDELRSEFIAEMQKGIRHVQATEAVATQDLLLNLTYVFPVSDAYGLPPLNPANGYIHILKPGGRLKEKTFPLSSSGSGTLTARIDKRDINQGYDSYYFNISADTGKLGTVGFTYPDNGRSAPFTYRIVTLEELKERRLAELHKSISHEQPAQTTGLEAVTIEVRSSAQYQLTGVLHVRKPSVDRYEDIKMTRTERGLAGVITAAMIRAGYTLYYFTVSTSFDDVGTVSADLKPESGPYGLKIAGAEPNAEKQTDSDKKQTELLDKKGWQNILDGITLEKVKTVESNKTFTVHIQVKQAPDNLIVFLNYRQAGDKKYVSAKMTKKGINFASDIPASILKSGKTIEYYFVLKAPSLKDDLTYPAAGENPLSFTVRDKGRDSDK